jgi:hypothetical protein
MIEMRPGQAAAPGRFIEIDGFGRRFAHMPQRPADAIIAGSARLVQPRGAVAPVRKPVSKDRESIVEARHAGLRDTPSAAPHPRGADRSRW